MKKNEHNALLSKPLKTLSDRELAKLRRSNLTSSHTLAVVVQEQALRGLLVTQYAYDTTTNQYSAEKLKNIKEYDNTPKQHIPLLDLDNLYMTLEQLKDKIEILIKLHGKDSIMYTDSGYEHAAVYLIAKAEK